jgi:hypothetical protein
MALPIIGIMEKVIVIKDIIDLVLPNTYYPKK